MLLLKIDKNLDKQQFDNEQDKHKDGDESNQQALFTIQTAIKGFESSSIRSFVSIRCWNTLPK